MKYRLRQDGERMPALGLGTFGIGNDPSQAGRKVTAIQAVTKESSKTNFLLFIRSFS